MSDAPKEDVSKDGDRIRRDIEEALRQGGADRLPPAPKAPNYASSVRLPDWRPRSPGQVMLVGGVLMVLTYLRLAGPLGSVLGPLGLALLAFGLLTWVLRPQRAETYWRGRRVDLASPASWWARVYRTIYRG